MAVSELCLLWGSYALLVRVVFISYKVEVLSALSKQYKQINENWFITRWKYRSDVLIYACGCEKDTGFPSGMEIN